MSLDTGCDEWAWDLICEDRGKRGPSLHKGTVRGQGTSWENVLWGGGDRSFEGTCLLGPAWASTISGDCWTLPRWCCSFGWTFCPHLRSPLARLVIASSPSH